MYRLVALDLDDTLLTTDKKISERNRQVLKRCLDKGIDIVTASGRFNESQLVFIKQMGLGLETKYHVGDGGGTIFNEAAVIQTIGIFKKDLYECVLEQSRSFGVPCFITNGDSVYYDIEDQPLCKVYGVMPTRRSYIFKIDDLNTVSRPLKFIFAYTNQEELEKIKAISCPETMTIHAGRNLIEITMKTLNKFSALKELGKIYQVATEEMVCIGDSENDISMIKGAGLGMV
ncbi:MAG: HAD-IIB family hydrolase, partial [Eubacterium sp.]